MKKPHNRFCIILLGVYFVIWGIFLWSRVEIYSYRFLTVLNSQGFLLLAIVVPCLPLVICVLAVVAIRKGREILVTILLALYLPVMIGAFFLSSIEISGWPTTCSYTADVDEFRNFDAAISEDLGINPVVAFPEEIPPQAEGIEYCYFYQSSSSDIVYIAVTWQIEDSQKFGELVQQYVMKPYDDRSYNSGCLQENEYYCNAVLLDNQTNQIGFVITNQEELLPNEVNNIIKNPATILD